MIHSMTGFGRGESARDGFKAVFEISSVNSRFLEISMRTPRWLTALEGSLKALIDKRLSRGKVFCQLTLEREGTTPTIQFNEPLADWYVETLRSFAEKHSLAGDLSIPDLTRLPDLWSGQAQAADEVIEGILQEALTAAVDGLIAARHTEGTALAKDLRSRLKVIGKVVAAVKVEADGVPAAIREKLTARVEELFASAKYDEQRLAQEIAYMAERADITEECVRLDVHCRHFEETLNTGGPVGRRLNFLMQEMNREANTIGSKSVTVENSKRVVDIKEELERIREQVQNIE